MKISNEQIQQILQTQGVKGKAGVQKAKGAAPADAVSVSAASQDVTKALAAIAKASDIRTEKVAELRERIENGTYNVAAEDLASSILGRNLADGSL